jgi:hypothetical protein
MIGSQASKQEVEVVFAEVSGGKKLSFLENFRATLSGPQHLPIAKNEEAKRHDRGTISQNEAFVACAGFMSEQLPLPVRSAKNYNSPASSSAVPSTKKRHNWNDLKIVANCKDTPIRRCSNDRPDPSRRQIDKTKIRGHPSSMGNRFRWRAWIGREGPFPR